MVSLIGSVRYREVQPTYLAMCSLNRMYPRTWRAAGEGRGRSGETFSTSMTAPLHTPPPPHDDTSFSIVERRVFLLVKTSPGTGAVDVTLLS